ncbi:MAG: hypothetical protein JXA42_07090, partial [Anaerolineales bacterium]|nr:hypothetical protein [Anaerolineales bacterium]
WVEEWGDDYGRHPMSAGMFRFKEWVQGEKIVLERNPNYNWGPEFSHGGPPYVENIEFLYIPEYATIIAGVEAGEIDFARINEVKDVQRIRDTGNYDILETVYNGAGPYLAMNVSMPPFDDIRVRKAFNMAADREALIQLVALGEAVPQYGPLSAGVIGYNPNADVLGAELYSFDLEAAKALMAEAGWVDNDGDGIVEKDGQPLELTMGIMAGRADMQKTGEILQEQLRALGVDVEIEIQEMGIVIENTIGGNFELSVFAYDMAEFDFSFILFMSQAANLPNHNDPKLDELLIKSRTTVDPAERQEIVNETQEYIVEQAYQVSLFAPKVFCAINKRVKDYVWDPPGGAFGQTPFFDNASISE